MSITVTVLEWFLDQRLPRKRNLTPHFPVPSVNNPRWQEFRSLFHPGIPKSSLLECSYLEIKSVRKPEPKFRR
jgi:hypothetical protein